MSKKYELNKADAKSVLITTLFVAISAVIPFLIDVVANTNFGQYSVVLIPVLTAGLKFAQKFIQGK